MLPEYQEISRRVFYNDLEDVREQVLFTGKIMKSQKKDLVYLSDKLVMGQHSELMHGKANSKLGTEPERPEMKMWTRWVDAEFNGIRRTPSGLLMPFSSFRHKETGRPRFRNVAVELSEETWAGVEYVFGASSYIDIFPQMRHYPELTVPPVGSWGALRSQTSREFVSKLFGKRNCRRDLIKACGSATFENVRIASYFKNYLHIERIIEVLRHSSHNQRPWADNFLANYPGWSNLMQIMPERLRLEYLLAINCPDWGVGSRRLTNGGSGRTIGAVRAVYDMAGRWEEYDIPVRKWRTIEEMHDDFIKAARSKRIKSVEIPPTWLSKELIKASDDEYTFIPASSTGQVRQWGVMQKHCIGSYANAARNGQYVLFETRRGDVVMGHTQVDLKRKSVVQSYSKYNSPIESAAAVKIKETLSNLGIKPG